MYTKEQRQALNKLFDCMDTLTFEFKQTTSAILNVLQSGVDPNEFIVKGYPFAHSFDEVDIMVHGWRADVQEAIGLATYQPETDPINNKNI